MGGGFATTFGVGFGNEGDGEVTESVRTTAFSVVTGKGFDGLLTGGDNSFDGVGLLNVVVRGGDKTGLLGAVCTTGFDRKLQKANPCADSNAAPVTA